MDIFKKAWNNFKVQPDSWFFYAFILTFTLSIRKILIFYPLAGDYNEYASISLYLSDIFLFLTFLSWIIILRNKYSILSIYKSKLSTLFTQDNLLITIPGLLILWFLISITWSNNWQIGLFRSIKLFEFYLLYLYLVYKIISSQSLRNVPSQYDRKCSIPVARKCSTWNISRATGQAWNNSGVRDRRGTFQEQRDRRGTIVRRASQLIISIGLFQAIIGIWQFIIQHSIGLFWLRESLISPDILGVAKIILNGEKYIRAYGLFPHPNVLGGFLLVSIILGLFYKQLFHACPGHQKCSTWNNSEQLGWNILVVGVEQFGRRGGTFEYLLPIFTLLQIIALILTFSKSAILGLVLAIIYIYWKLAPSKLLSNVLRLPRTLKLFHACPGHQKCSTWNNSEQLGWNILVVGVEQFGRRGGTIMTIFIIIILVGLLGANLNLDDYLFKSLNERTMYVKASPQYKIICSTPIIRRLFHVEQSSTTGHAWNNLCLKDSRKTMENTWTMLSGIGSGQFVLEMQTYTQKTLAFWEYQPVHNVFLLIWAELGIIGLFVFFWFLWQMFHPSTTENVPRGTFQEQRDRPARIATQSVAGGRGTLLKHMAGLPAEALAKEGVEQIVIFRGILLGLLFIMLFDHYLWDIQQGQILLWMILGFIAGNRLNSRGLSRPSTFSIQ